MGTAFLYRHVDAQHYLVTAWHNFSGRNFVTKKELLKWFPTRIEFSFKLKLTEPAGIGAGLLGPISLPLYEDEAYSKATWLVHGKLGSALDVAVIPVRDIVDYLAATGYEHSNFVQDLNVSTGSVPVKGEEFTANFQSCEARDFAGTLEVANDVFVVGFPQNISGGESTAIWKRGSVASEPEIPLSDRDCFLIDTATRPGLSGAPVLGRFIKPRITLEGNSLIVPERLGLCGVYTGRIGAEGSWSDPFPAQLGIVWKENVITSSSVNNSQVFDFRI